MRRPIRAAAGLLSNPTFRRVLLASPAVIVGTAALLLAAWLGTNPVEIRPTYEIAALQAQQRKDTATARICLDRLTLLKAKSGLASPDSVTRLARLAFDLGQAERAQVLLGEAAPDDHAVHAPAHLMRAALLLQRPEGGEGPLPADRLRAERHLQYALALDPAMPEAHEILGRIAAQRGDLPLAEMHLQHAAKANPALSYQVALLIFQQGRPESAAIWARQAGGYFNQLCEQDPGNHNARLFWASSELLLKNYEAARTILRRGLSRENRPEFHQQLAASYLTEAAELARQGKGDEGPRLALLEQALGEDPSNPALVEQISDVLKGDGPGTDRFRGRLQALLAGGQSVTTAHLLLGYDAWEHGRPDEARLHWERSLEANPRSAVVANNLAWALASGPNPDLPRALSLVDAVLGADSRDPTLLSTRGRILARLGRHKEALAALEAALPAMPRNQELHSDLAGVYAALGSTDLAGQHRRLAGTPPGGRDDRAR